MLDEHLSAIHEVFGSEVEYRLRVAVSRSTRRPVQLFIEIERPSDDPVALERLVEVQQRLLADESSLAERSRRPRPFANIAVTLALPPTDWDRFVDADEADW